jgi:hypothetical protein
MGFGVTTGPGDPQLHWPSGYEQSSPTGEQSMPCGTATYEPGHIPGTQCAGGGTLQPAEVQRLISLQAGFASVPYSQAIPATWQGVPPAGGLAGQAGAPPSSPPEPPPLELLLPPELLVEPPCDPELDPDPEPPSPPPSPDSPGVNVVPPQAHIAATVTTARSFERIVIPSNPRRPAKPKSNGSTRRETSANSASSRWNAVPAPTRASWRGPAAHRQKCAR